MARRTILFLIACTLRAAIPVCPAGMPLGNVALSVKRTPDAPALAWRDINRIEEGDTILYKPVLRPNEKREGKVAIVLIASTPQDDQQHDFVVLEPQDAKEPAEWKVPFRASLAVFVYGPNGVSTRKLRGLVAKDQDLVAQLADYAEKTEQTENLVQALSAFERAGASENLQAALTGFSSQYGLTNRIDRNAPMEQQTRQLFNSLNPALSAYDPMAASSTQRLSQTAGLATAVAGMFFGNPVGLAAGGAAMTLNLKTIMFPNTEFRSSYVQNAGPADTVSVCGKREGSQGRTRLAYMWARRLPDTHAPQIRIEGPNNVARALKTPLLFHTPDDQWKLVPRVRQWFLETPEGKETPVSVYVLGDGRKVEIDLSKADVAPGTYRLSGRWDWDDFEVSGEVAVRELASMNKVRPAPESQNRLRQRNGKQVVTLEGADFQFVEKVQLVAKGDKYAKPYDVPFTLPKGLRHGPQGSIEMQVDTTPLTAGQYALLLFQQDGKPREADLPILPDPPVIENLPVVLHEGEPETLVTLKGRQLDRITSLEADGLQFELRGNGQVLVRGSEIKRGNTITMRVGVKDYPQPLVLENAIRIAPPRPQITKADLVLPSDLQISLQAKELPAGAYTSAMLETNRAGASPVARLGCTDGGGPVIEVPAGGQAEGARLQLVQSDRLFLSFNPGVWPMKCLLTVAIQNEGRSDAVELGRVVRMPRITGFRLTDEPAGDGQYYAFLTGQGLELIERTGWTDSDGVAVADLPTAGAGGDATNQSLRVKMPWPSPSPRAPLFLWMRGEQQGRATTVRP